MLPLSLVMFIHIIHLTFNRSPPGEFISSGLSIFLRNVNKTRKNKSFKKIEENVEYRYKVSKVS